MPASTTKFSDFANGGTLLSTDTMVGLRSGVNTYFSATTIVPSTSTSNQMLQSVASSSPVWSSATWPATTTANQILFSSATNTVTGLSSANSSFLITSSGGVPSLASTVPFQITGTNGMAISGNTISLNDSSNSNTQINSVSSTGAITIGNASSGNVTLTSNGFFTINTQANRAGAFSIGTTSSVITLNTQNTTSGITCVVIAPAYSITIPSSSSANYINTSITAPGSFTFSGTTTINSSSSFVNFSIAQPLIKATSALSINEMNTQRINGGPIATNVTSGTLTVTRSVALRIINNANVASTGATVTSAYSIYADQPAGATNNYGAVFTGSTTRVVIGATTGSSDSNFVISGILGNSILINGTQQSPNTGGNITGIYLSSNINPQGGLLPIGAQIYINGKFSAASGAELSSAYGIYISNDVSSNVGSIDNLMGIYISAGSSGAGTIGESYGLYCEQPTAGTDRYCAFFNSTIYIGGDDGVGRDSSIGFTNTTTSGHITLVGQIKIYINGTPYYISYNS